MHVRYGQNTRKHRFHTVFYQTGTKVRHTSEQVPELPRNFTCRCDQVPHLLHKVPRLPRQWKRPMSPSATLATRMGNINITMSATLATQSAALPGGGPKPATRASKVQQVPTPATQNGTSMSRSATPAHAKWRGAPGRLTATKRVLCRPTQSAGGMSPSAAPCHAKVPAASPRDQRRPSGDQKRATRRRWIVRQVPRLPCKVQVDVAKVPRLPL